MKFCLNEFIICLFYSIFYFAECRKCGLIFSNCSDTLSQYFFSTRKYLRFDSIGPLTFAPRADRRAHDRRFFNWSHSSVWPCRLGVSGLELPLESPETETDMDMDIDVDADTDVDIEARLPALSQSLTFPLPLDFPLGLIEQRSAAATSASLDVPVSVDTGLVLVEASVCVSKLVKLLNEVSWPRPSFKRTCGLGQTPVPETTRPEAPGKSTVSTTGLPRRFPEPNKRPSLM